MSFEFIRDLEMATSGDVSPGQLSPGSVGDIALDDGADSGSSLIHERIEFVLLHFNDAHNVVPLNGDVIWSTVLDDDLAVLVAVNGDK